MRELVALLTSCWLDSEPAGPGVHIVELVCLVWGKEGRGGRRACSNRGARRTSSRVAPAAAAGATKKI